MNIDKLNELLDQIKPIIDRYVTKHSPHTCPACDHMRSLRKPPTFPEPATDPWEERG